MPTQSEQRPERDAAVTAEHQREPPAGESGLDTISDAHCEHGDPFRVEHVRVGVTRRAIRRDIDADDFGGLEKPMQTGFPERVGGVLHSARMESESGRHLDDSELRSRPRGQSMPALGA
jgi:hypothetical protein